MECWINLLVWNARRIEDEQILLLDASAAFSSEWTERVPMTRREMFRGIFGFRRKRPSPEEKTEKDRRGNSASIGCCRAFPLRYLRCRSSKKGKRKSGDSSSYGLVDPVAIL